MIVRTLGSSRLREAVESLKHQTLRDFEVVVVDMSKVGAAHIMEDFRDCLPTIRNVRIGRPLSRADALNQGIRNSSAASIAILDEDNVYDPEHLETLVRGLNENGVDLVYTGVRRTTYNNAAQLVDTTEWQRSYDFKELLRGNYIHTAGTAFRRTIWERLGGYDSRFPVYEDYDFLLRVASIGRIRAIPTCTAESRSFTGIPGMQNHALNENEAVRRCEAGVRWVHRKLHSSSKVSRSNIDSGDERHSVRAGILGTLNRLRKTVDLVDWWWHHSLPQQKRS